MYLRFTLLARSRDSHRKQGLLVAAHELCDAGALPVEQHRSVRLILDWFNENLHVPGCLREPDNRRALSWFKPEARKPLQYMWQLVGTLTELDIQIELHKTREPGSVLYEDGWQLVAKPRRSMRAGW